MSVEHSSDSTLEENSKVASVGGQLKLTGKHSLAPVFGLNTSFVREFSSVVANQVSLFVLVNQESQEESVVGTVVVCPDGKHALIFGEGKFKTDVAVARELVRVHLLVVHPAGEVSHVLSQSGFFNCFGSKQVESPLGITFFVANLCSLLYLLGHEVSVLIEVDFALAGWFEPGLFVGKLLAVVDENCALPPALVVSVEEHFLLDAHSCVANGEVLVHCMLGVSNVDADFVQICEGETLALHSFAKAEADVVLLFTIYDSEDSLRRVAFDNLLE